MADIVPSVPYVVKLTAANEGVARKGTVAIVVHGTRGPNPQRAGESLDSWLQREYQATVGYCLNKANQVGPHFVVGPREVTRMLPDDRYGWCQTVDNPTCIGIEVAQPEAEPPFTDFQYKALANLCAQLCEKFGLPIVYLGKQTTPTVQAKGILGHEDTYAGYSRGKSDPGHEFDWQRFIALAQAEHDRLYAPAPPPAPTAWDRVGEGLKAYLKAHPEYGGPAAVVDSGYDKWGNEVVVTAAVPAYPTGVYHIARRYLNWKVRSVVWD